MENKYRILIIHNKYKIPGGEDIVVKNEIELLQKYGHLVISYIRENIEIDEMNILKKVLLPFTTFFSLKAYKDIKRIIKENKIDVVHVHNTLPLISYSVYYAAKKSNCKLVQTIHNFRLICPNGLLYRNGEVCEECINYSLSKSLVHKCYRNSKIQTFIVATNLKLHRLLGTFELVDIYIALTEFNKKKLERIIPIEKIVVKPNYIENSEKYFVEKPKDYFIFVGRLEEEKGIQMILEAFLELPEQEVLIVGTGNEADKVKQFVQQNNMQNVKLLGYVEHEKILKLIAESKALLVPSQWYEGFPMTIVESFSVGTPVIGSNMGNVAAIIQEGYNGFLFNNNSINSLIETINKYSVLHDELSFIKKNALNTYFKDLSPDINYSILKKIYDE